MNQHPAEGARIIMQSDEDLDLAAVVAYEHHIMLNGGGYPAMHYDRDVHAGEPPRARLRRLRRAPHAGGPTARRGRPRRRCAYLEERAGLEFDPDLVTAFVQMLRQGEAQVRVLSEETSI